jgi:AcrR family transcriptional regulator
MAARKPDLSSFAGAELSEKHREILRAALHLLAERGYRGASLRELARRVGMRQPSLYHYFKSKDDLVEQVLRTFGPGGVGNTPDFQVPERVEEMPAIVVMVVQYLYDHTDWPLFVRVLFNVSLETTKFEALMHELFAKTSDQLMRVAVAHYVETGQISETDGAYLARMVINAIGLALIEERLLFPHQPRHPWMPEFSAFVARFAAAGAAQLPRPPGKTGGT